MFDAFRNFDIAPVNCISPLESGFSLSRNLIISLLKTYRPATKKFEGALFGEGFSITSSKGKKISFLFPFFNLTIP